MARACYVTGISRMRLRLTGLPEMVHYSRRPLKLLWWGFFCAHITVGSTAWPWNQMCHEIEALEENTINELFWSCIDSW